ncbi:MAG: DUF6542 domain-containing protein [Jatrophihabitans sp.]|uniref:DUF6542 domain-containing protein n=1 Tax=Jatrophihabitans sp. TaxID=1932789 RepID=UPI003F81CF12
MSDPSTPDADRRTGRTGANGRSATDLPPLPPELDPRGRGRGRHQASSGQGATRAQGPRGGRADQGVPVGRRGERTDRGTDRGTGGAPWGRGPGEPALAGATVADRYAAASAGYAPDPDATPKRRERGLPGWAALLVLVVIAAIGGIIDTATNVQVRGGFNIGIVAASVIAILAVRRSSMLLIVLSPPIVYSAAAMFMLYLRSGGLDNRTEVINAALNYLVYGFPAIATATTAVLLIAVVRQLTKR